MKYLYILALVVAVLATVAALVLFAIQLTVPSPGMIMIFYLPAVLTGLLSSLVAYSIGRSLPTGARSRLILRSVGGLLVLHLGLTIYGLLS